MSAPLPGCDAYLPTLPPQQADPGTGETLQKTLVTSYLSIDGDMDRRPLPNVLDAIRKAIARYTSVRWLDAEWAAHRMVHGGGCTELGDETVTL
eukprot:Skav234636  [mRNA]  locus=scaffold1609:103864:105176:+ [translate_table: standard]